MNREEVTADLLNSIGILNLRNAAVPNDMRLLVEEYFTADLNENDSFESDEDVNDTELVENGENVAELPETEPTVIVDPAREVEQQNEIVVTDGPDAEMKKVLEFR